MVVVPLVVPFKPSKKSAHKRRHPRVVFSLSFAESWILSMKTRLQVPFGIAHPRSQVVHRQGYQGSNVRPTFDHLSKAWSNPDRSSLAHGTSRAVRTARRQIESSTKADQRSWCPPAKGNLADDSGRKTRHPSGRQRGIISQQQGWARVGQWVGQWIGQWVGQWVGQMLRK